MKLEIDGLVQGYGRKIVLEDISMEISTGELVTVLGPNGSGKSTLIKTICNVMPPKSGTIMIDGNDSSSIPKKEFAKIVAYVPQSTMSFSNTSVYDTVLAGRRPYIEWSYSADDVRIAADAMRTMHIDDLHDRSVSDLSGGQKQRAHIARALAQDSDIFVLDEPTSALDLKHQIDTMGIMQRLTKQNGKGALVALHDINLALNYSDRVIVLKDKKIYDQGRPSDVITTKMISDVYGVSAEIVKEKNGTFIHPFKPLWMEDSVQ